MCKLCDEGKPQNHWNPRRGFLKAAAATGAGVDSLITAGSCCACPTQCLTHSGSQPRRPAISCASCSAAGWPA